MHSTSEPCGAPAAMLHVIPRTMKRLQSIHVSHEACCDLLWPGHLPAPSFRCWLLMACLQVTSSVRARRGRLLPKLPRLQRPRPRHHLRKRPQQLLRRLKHPNRSKVVVACCGCLGLHGGTAALEMEVVARTGQQAVVFREWVVVRVCVA